MASKAEVQLQSLLEMQEQGEANISHSKRLLDARDEFTPQSGGTAGFALPESLATAVGAGWLLGPVGGLLMGVAQGILTKRERQNALDAFAEDNQTLAQFDDVFNDELDRMALATRNEDDLEQLRGMQAEKDAALKLMSSANPDLQAQGSSMMSTFQDNLNAYATTQETQRIEAEVRDADATRALGSEQKSNWLGLVDDYDRQSANYEQTMLSGNQALQMIERGNPVDIVSALIAVNKTLDPTSVVRPEEAAALSGGGDVLEQATRWLEEKAGSGIALKVDDRRELMQLVRGIQETSTGFQSQRDIRFQGRANKLELPNDFVQEFRRAQSLPAFESTGIQEQPSFGDDVDAAIIDTASRAIEGTVDAVSDGIGSFKDFLSRDVDPEELDEKIRQARLP